MIVAKFLAVVKNMNRSLSNNSYHKFLSDEDFKFEEIWKRK